MAATTREPFRSQCIFLAEQFDRLKEEAERLYGAVKNSPAPTIGRGLDL
jgi:hypothetical protein